MLSTVYNVTETPFICNELCNICFLQFLNFFNKCLSATNNANSNLKINTKGIPNIAAEFMRKDGSLNLLIIDALP